MAKFFIPGNGPQRSEEIYVWIIRYVREMLDCEIEPVRIYSMSYSRDGQRYTARVGEEEPRTRQLVIAILRSTQYLICTPYYGVRRGEPMKVEFADAAFSLGGAPPNLSRAPLEPTAAGFAGLSNPVAPLFTRTKDGRKALQVVG